MSQEEEKANAPMASQSCWSKGSSVKKESSVLGVTAWCSTKGKGFKFQKLQITAFRNSPSRFSIWNIFSSHLVALTARCWYHWNLGKSTTPHIIFTIINHDCMIFIGKPCTSARSAVRIPFVFQSTFYMETDSGTLLEESTGSSIPPSL